MTLHLCLLFAASAAAQCTNCCQEVPKTKLEQFAARTGVVLIKASTEAGSVVAKGGTIVVKTKEYTDVASGQREYGVAVELMESDHSLDVIVIDVDELRPLLTAVDYISTVNPTVTTLPTFQAVYVTRGELQVSTYFSRRTGTMEASVRSNRNPAIGAHLSMAQLAQFRTAIDAANRIMEEVRASKP